MRLIIATSNEDKVREIDEILEGTGFKAVSMKEAGFCPEIIEDGKTFEENALIKAKAVHALTDSNDYVMADDSGLCIDALDGAPGIYSARFCGENSTYPEKFAKIFTMLKDVPEEKRTARFVCAIAVAGLQDTHAGIAHLAHDVTLQQGLDTLLGMQVALCPQADLHAVEAGIVAEEL